MYKKNLFGFVIVHHQCCWLCKSISPSCRFLRFFPLSNAQMMLMIFVGFFIFCVYHQNYVHFILLKSCCTLKWSIWRSVNIVRKIIEVSIFHRNIQVWIIGIVEAIWFMMVETKDCFLSKEKQKYWNKKRNNNLNKQNQQKKMIKWNRYTIWTKNG